MISKLQEFCLSSMQRKHDFNDVSNLSVTVTKAVEKRFAYRDIRKCKTINNGCCHVFLWSSNGTQSYMAQIEKTFQAAPLKDCNVCIQSIIVNILENWCRKG